ncbi:unnamed protein product, partial [Chrysoparadoxa australica]
HSLEDSWSRSGNSGQIPFRSNSVPLEQAGRSGIGKVTHIARPRSVLEEGIQQHQHQHQQQQRHHQNLPQPRGFGVNNTIQQSAAARKRHRDTQSPRYSFQDASATPQSPRLRTPNLVHSPGAHTLGLGRLHSPSPSPRPYGGGASLGGRRPTSGRPRNPAVPGGVGFGSRNGQSSSRR